MNFFLLFWILFLNFNLFSSTSATGQDPRNEPYTLSLLEKTLTKAISQWIEHLDPTPSFWQDLIKTTHFPTSHDGSLSNSDSFLFQENQIKIQKKILEVLKNSFSELLKKKAKFSPSQIYKIHLTMMKITNYFFFPFLKAKSMEEIIQKLETTEGKKNLKACGTFILIIESLNNYSPESFSPENRTNQTSKAELLQIWEDFFALLENNSLDTFFMEAEASIHHFLPIYEDVFENNEQGASQYINVLSDFFPNFIPLPPPKKKNLQEVNDQLIHYVQNILPERIKTIVENIILVRLKDAGLSYEDTQSDFWRKLDDYCYEKFGSSCFSNPVGWCLVRNVLQTMLEFHERSFYLNNTSLKDIEDKLEHMYRTLWEVSHIKGNKPFTLFSSVIKRFLENLQTEEQYKNTAFQEKIQMWLKDKNTSSPI